MILGRSELLRRIKGINEESFESYFVKLSKHGLTRLRFNCLKKLADLEKATVSSILKEINETSSGGTYITINTFFEKLKKEKILKKQKVGKLTYWSFDKPASDFAEYIKEVN